jgi:hypothetical protein
MVDILIDVLRQADLEVKREKDYQLLKAKIEKEFPVRQKLAKILGRKLSDETIRELFVDILIYKPEHDNAARQIIQGHEDQR